MALDRKIVMSLLTKFGVKEPGKLAAPRAEKKLRHRVKRNDGAAPEGVELSDAEKKVIAAILADDEDGEGEAKAGTSKPEPAEIDEDSQPSKPEDDDQDEEEPPKRPKAGKGTGNKPKAATGHGNAGTARKNTGGNGAAAAFRDAFKSRKQFERQELVQHVMANSKADKYLVANYIALAKKKPEIFGFRLEEVKKGDKKLLVKSN